MYLRVPCRLIGYSALLGPLAGIAIADYWLIRKRQLDVDSLYSMRPDGAYWYKVRQLAHSCLKHEHGLQTITLMSDRHRMAGTQRHLLHCSLECCRTSRASWSSRRHGHRTRTARFHILVCLVCWLFHICCCVQFPNATWLWSSRLCSSVGAVLTRITSHILSSQSHVQSAASSIGAFVCVFSEPLQSDRTVQPGREARSFLTIVPASSDRYHAEPIKMSKKDHVGQGSAVRPPLRQITLQNRPKAADKLTGAEGGQTGYFDTRQAAARCTALHTPKGRRGVKSMTDTLRRSMNLWLLLLEQSLRVVLAQPLYELVRPDLAACCAEEGNCRP